MVMVTSTHPRGAPNARSTRTLALLVAMKAGNLTEDFEIVADGENWGLQSQATLVEDVGVDPGRLDVPSASLRTDVEVVATNHIAARVP